MMKWLFDRKPKAGEPDPFSAAIAAQVRPRYVRQIKRGVDPETAYSQAYEELAKILAKIENTTVDKIKFSAIHVLQEAMTIVTQ